MRVVPLAITRINWDAYILAIKELTGTAPTKILDEKGINITSLLSYPLIMGLDSQIDYSMLQKTTRLNHIFCSYMIQTSSPLEIENFNALYTYIVSLDRKMCITVLSGTLMQWRESIHNVLKQDDYLNSEVYEVFKEIHGSLVKIGGAFIWTGQWQIR